MQVPGHCCWRDQDSSSSDALSSTLEPNSSDRVSLQVGSPNQIGRAMGHESGHCQRNVVPELNTSLKSHPVTYPSPLGIGQAIPTINIPKKNMAALSNTYFLLSKSQITANCSFNLALKRFFFQSLAISDDFELHREDSWVKHTTQFQKVSLTISLSHLAYLYYPE